MNTII